MGKVDKTKRKEIKNSVRPKLYIKASFRINDKNTNKIDILERRRISASVICEINHNKDILEYITP